jgi:hypothetical protein
MKTIALLLVVLFTTFCSLSLEGQTYLAQQGKIHFFSKAPLENIEATSNEASCLLNTATKHITAKVEIKSFAFAKPLMQQHFNDSYLESDKYPEATLEASFTEEINLKKDGVYPVTLKGKFSLHGVTKERTIPGKITVKNGQPEKADAEFDVKLADHRIKIPTAVVAKIAEVVKVDVHFIFNKVK